MLSLHQLRCFLAAYEQGSFTAAALELGYAQPSLSEQIRLLERSLGVSLFRRAGRGVEPTGAADALRPHAERTLAEAAAARAAVASVTTHETGTVRFGMFGTARLYLGADLVADLLEQYPGVRVELVGQNSAEVLDDLRRGRLDAAMIALPVADESMAVTPVAREELVYISADPGRLENPVTPKQLSEATLVLAETTWRTEDSARVSLARFVQSVGRSLTTRIEVEDVESAVEIVGRGLADAVVPKGVLAELVPRLAPSVGWVSLRPQLYETMAVVHRRDAVLLPAIQLLIRLATQRILALAEAPAPPQGPPASGHAYSRQAARMPQNRPQNRPQVSNPGDGG
ncbi:MAG TPA: LysR family transcriptional regulator [Actinomycetales bacterium]|nr:LysR family transcriptional regulator [Actinomycetales bacterium]